MAPQRRDSERLSRRGTVWRIKADCGRDAALLCVLVSQPVLGPGLALIFKEDKK